MSAVFANYQEKTPLNNDVYLVDNKPFCGVQKQKLKDSIVEKRYLNGLLHGIQKEYFYSGQLKTATIFTGGTENGRHIEYYECGSKKLNANYSNGDLEGLYEEWTALGQLVTRKTFYHGKLIAVKTCN